MMRHCTTTHASKEKPKKLWMSFLQSGRNTMKSQEWGWSNQSKLWLFLSHHKCLLRSLALLTHNSCSRWFSSNKHTSKCWPVKRCSLRKRISTWDHSKPTATLNRHSKSLKPPKKWWAASLNQLTSWSSRWHNKYSNNQKFYSSHSTREDMRHLPNQSLWRSSSATLNQHRTQSKCRRSWRKSGHSWQWTRGEFMRELLRKLSNLIIEIYD